MAETKAGLGGLLGGVAAVIAAVAALIGALYQAKLPPFSNRDAHPAIITPVPQTLEKEHSGAPQKEPREALPPRGGGGAGPVVPPDPPEFMVEGNWVGKTDSFHRKFLLFLAHDASGNLEGNVKICALIPGAPPATHPIDSAYWDGSRLVLKFDKPDPDMGLNYPTFDLYKSQNELTGTYSAYKVEGATFRREKTACP